MAFAIWFMLSILRECIAAAVWWQPPSRSCTAGAMASSTLATRTTGSTGIIISGDGKRMVGGRFHKQARLIRDVQADGCGDLARVTTDPVTADGCALPRSSIFFSSTGWAVRHRRRSVSPRLATFPSRLAHQLVGDAIHHNQHFFFVASR